MARGWESKSVESQMEDARFEAAAAAARPNLSPEDTKRQTARESLELSRQRVLHDLECTPHQRRRDQLNAALQFLDDQMRQLG